MGTGASAAKSKEKDRRSQVRANDEDDELRKLVRERRKSVHSLASPQLDPHNHLEEGQELVYSSKVWKLNFGANLEDPEEWLERTMWLTNTGGLFYYSSRFKAPLGRLVSEFTVVNNEKKALGRWLLELYTIDDVSNKMPTVLAVESVEERNEWVKCLDGFVESESTDIHTPFVPLGPAMGRSESLKRVRRAKSGFHVRATNSCAQFFAHSIAKSTVLGKQLSLASQGSEVGGACAFGVVASQHGFDEKRNSVLVLDWDDTLFPTYFLREDCGLNLRHSISDQAEPGEARDELEMTLNRFSLQVEEFLDLAVSLANVVVITLARRPWVADSSRRFAPRIYEALERHQIEIVYTREKMTEEMFMEDVAGMFKTQEEETDFWTRGKAIAMKHAIDEAYAKSGGSWKNIMSFGDSFFEQMALKQVSTDHMAGLCSQQRGSLIQTGVTSVFVASDGQVQRLRTKTLKMIDDPSLDMLIAQMNLLTKWLPCIVSRDEGLDIEIPEVDDDASITEMNHFVTGKQDELTWLGLADMDEHGNVVAK